MARKKNLERAIVLGLILSTSIYGSAWAVEIGAIDATKSDAEYTTETEYTITTTGNKNGITVGDGHQVIIGSEQNNKVNTVTINAEDSGLTSEEGGGTVIINANDEISITGNDMVCSALSAGAAGTEYSLNSAKISINGDYGGAINIGSNSIISITAAGTNDTENNDIVNNIVSTSARGTINLSAGELNITAEKGSNYIESTAGSGFAISTSNLGTANVIATNGQNIIKAGGYAIQAQGSNVTLTALSNKITANNRGVYAYKNEGTTVDIKAEGTGENGYNEVYGMFTGVYAGGQNETGRSEVNEIKLTADNGKNIITQGNKDRAWTNTSDAGVYATHNGKVTMTALANEITADNEGVEGYLNSDITITATDGDNKITSNWSGIKTNERRAQEGEGTYSAKIKLLAQNGDNIIESGKDVVLGTDSPNEQEKYHGYGIHARYSSDVKLTAYGDNIIKAGNLLEENNGYYNGIAIGAGVGTSDSSHTVVTIETANKNDLKGAIYATAYSNVNLQGIVDDSNQYTASNNVYSAAVIANAGGLTGKNTVDNVTTGMDVVSALYAEKGAEINLSGYNNIYTYYSDPNDKHTSERSVWAYKGADITIDGNTNISTSSYESSPNDMDIAIAAGTATGLNKDDFDDKVLGNLDIANVTLNYENNGESKSSITGDILSAYGGVVDIKAKEGVGRAVSDAGINIHGNLLAGNTGVLNVDIGKGSTLTGRADDYGDAGVEGTTHGAGEDTANSFFNPAFSSEIITGGEVNLTMGEGSVWNVTGQSWITSLTTTGNAEDTLISLKNAKEDLNSNASALTIGTLKGDTRFYMNLDGDRSASDMLYIKNADGKYDIYLQEEVLSSEINSDKAGNTFNGLRFATVGEGNAEFTVRSQGTGSAFDVEYEVGTDSYENNSENTAYNSTGGGEGNVEKPGNASVDDFFGLNDTSSQANAENNIMLMAETDEAIDTAANSAENSTLDEVTNFKIVARLGEEISDTGKTILNMSRANYSNAIYMDRLNKRLGEARYINSEEDEGMWVRIRHDRIGKDDAYRSQNTMYELGYDQKQECDNGERRVGMAIDYMHGDTGYKDIAGKGEIDRYGLWLYDTWMGDKGHYADYVAKWGHLSNDFEVYTMQNGDKVTGDYSNNVFSVSAEYGRKKDIGNDWYFEPQVQAQLARVTGADYTTNQGTKVSVDGINSLIGRAGFRLGKDFGAEKQSTVYIKADVLHEFLGDQDVRVLDKSSDNKWAGISYENEGTWYDVGFGFATQMSKNSYAFMDFEKSFGNDNDETYQINVGMQWSF